MTYHCADGYSDYHSLQERRKASLAMGLAKKEIIISYQYARTTLVTENCGDDGRVDYRTRPQWLIRLT